MKSPINPKTRISELIKANPLVIDALAELNPNFSKLKNPVLRNLLARRVSISDACAIAGCRVSDFLDKMVVIGFTTNKEPGQSVYKDDSNVMEAISGDVSKVLVLDVRPGLAAGSDPLKEILKASKALKSDECLKVINTFEPIPLIKLLAKQGFRSWSEWPEEGLVYTWFVKDKSVEVRPAVSVIEPSLPNEEMKVDKLVEYFGPGRIRTIDVRDMEMPQPMVSILENLPEIKDDEALLVYHKKVPVYLLPLLKERGFKYLMKDCQDGKINMLIWKV